MLLDVLDERLNDTGIALGRRHMNSGIAGLRLKKLQLRDQADVATPRVGDVIDEHAMHDLASQYGMHPHGQWMSRRRRRRTISSNGANY